MSEEVEEQGGRTSRLSGWLAYSRGLAAIVASFIPLWLALRWADSQIPARSRPIASFLATLPIAAVWLAFPLVLGFTLRLSRARRIAIASVFAVGAAAFTIWMMRPTAPDGSEYDIDLAQGASLLSAEVTEALDTALPGRWEWHSDRRSECTDSLARDRGAAFLQVDLRVSGGISLDDQSALESAFEELGWVVNYEPVNLAGGPGRRFRAEREGMTVETWGTFLDERADQPDDLSAQTPCLRRN